MNWLELSYKSDLMVSPIRFSALATLESTHKWILSTLKYASLEEARKIEKIGQKPPEDR
jgi:hypothetical protein